MKKKQHIVAWGPRIGYPPNFDTDDIRRWTARCPLCNKERYTAEELLDDECPA